MKPHRLSSNKQKKSITNQRKEKKQKKNHFNKKLHLSVIWF